MSNQENKTQGSNPTKENKQTGNPLNTPTQEQPGAPYKPIRKAATGKTRVVHFPDEYREAGYVYRVANFDPKRPGRLAELQALGYEKVTTDMLKSLQNVLTDVEMSSMSSLVEVPVGDGVTGILVRCRIEDFEEGIRLKRAERAKNMSAIFKGGENSVDLDNGYVDIDAHIN